jgi:hypothetical protein
MFHVLGVVKFYFMEIRLAAMELQNPLDNKSQILPSILLQLQFNSNIFSNLGLKISELKIEKAENIGIVHRVTRNF